jgi:hypothetical protein
MPIDDAELAAGRSPAKEMARREQLGVYASHPQQFVF